MESLRKISPEKEEEIPNPSFANDNGEEPGTPVRESANDNERIVVTSHNSVELPTAVNDNNDSQLEQVTEFEQESSDKERISQIKERLGRNEDQPATAQEAEIGMAREHSNSETAERAAGRTNTASGAAGGTSDGGAGGEGGDKSKEKGGGASSHSSSGDEKGSGWLMKILKFGFIAAGLGIMAIKKLTEKAFDWSGLNKGGGGGGSAKKPSSGGHGGGHDHH